MTDASTTKAAILILARDISRSLDGKLETVSEICQSLKTSRSQAYEMLERVTAALGKLHRPPGRSPRPENETVELGLLVAVREFLMEHPGCVESRDSRRVYHSIFRDFVLNQLCPGGAAATLTHERAAFLLGVPLGTLKDWLAAPKQATPEAADEIPKSADPKEPHFEVANPRIAIILREFRHWKGSFEGFCQFLKDKWDILLGKTFIARVLELAGLRQQKRQGREKRPWSPGTFRALFPGAQWIGDGKTVLFEWSGEKMVFNFEAFIDSASGAVVGLEVTDTEDEAAVLAAHAHALATTGGDPLAVSLDRRPSNHTDAVRDAVAPAELMATIKARPTAKAPVEGMFGLFSQTAPPLAVTGVTAREQARSTLRLFLLGWAWARNRRPRRRLGGGTPVDFYRNAKPTPEEIQAAKAYLFELKQREENARRSLADKADPVRRQILDEAFRALDIVDPDGMLIPRLAASYSREAIVQGIARFRIKMTMGTLPLGADPGRYLAGIIRRIHAEIEDQGFAAAMLDLRIRQRDISLALLENEAATMAREADSPSRLAWTLLTKALSTPHLIDYRFWLEKTKRALADLPPKLRLALYSWMTRIVSRAHRTPRDRRRELIAMISAEATAAAG
jgi:transposase InsO family protein